MCRCELSALFVATYSLRAFRSTRSRQTQQFQRSGTALVLQPAQSIQQHSKYNADTIEYSEQRILGDVHHLRYVYVDFSFVRIFTFLWLVRVRVRLQMY